MNLSHMKKLFSEIHSTRRARVRPGVADRRRKLFLVESHLDVLEDRRLLATTSFSGGLLTINFNASAEQVVINNDGTNIILSSTGAITGSGSSFATSGVHGLTVTDSGNLTGQLLNFAPGSVISLSSGLSVDGIETVLVNNTLEVTGSSVIGVTRATSVTTAGSMTTAGGSFTLQATNGITLTRPILTNGGVQTLNGDSDSDGTGSLALDFAVTELVDPNPAPGNLFGSTTLVLTSGNVVVTSPNDDYNYTDSGAVYLFNGFTGQLISTFRGAGSWEHIGGNGVTALTNGNYVVRSNLLSRGAVTWGSGTNGISGVVSSINSLVGTSDNDHIGNARVTALTNGNYVVVSAFWDNNGVENVGAVTWGNGTTGVSGNVSPTNSLIGSTTSDCIGSLEVTALSNGNYVVRSPNWDNDTNSNAGAVTWGNGTTGISGYVTSINSLVGTSPSDQVGETGLTTLTNGNYVVSSLSWTNGGATSAGAATWGSGITGVSGVVSSTNSLVGTSTNDRVGSSVRALTNGNYVVSSPGWGFYTGAVTWGNGISGISGNVTATNSLTGSSPDNSIGSGGVKELANGNYLVISPGWDNSGAVDAGAVTWGNGTTGISGDVSSTNSLVGTLSYSAVGYSEPVALSNGNYLVISPSYCSPTAPGVGAVTWGSGATGVSGPVSSTNSLIGSYPYDRIGENGVTTLTNGNYVVISPNWANSGAMSAGAVTWGDGTTGISGVVSSTNSLVGTTASDYVGNGYGGVTALTNGNYVVISPNWDNSGVVNAGAVTWGNGTTGISGVVSYTNSLVGTTASDTVGWGMGSGVTALTNGNYVVVSPNWDNVGAVDAGAVTWGDGTNGMTGSVTPVNSLVGTTASNNVGFGGVAALTNGNYVAISYKWDNVGAQDAGAVTWGDGTTGISGNLTSINSLVGTSANDQAGYGRVTALSNGNYVVGSPFWNKIGATLAGAVTWGNGTSGVYGDITATNSLVGDSDYDLVGGSNNSDGIRALSNGNYLVISPYWNNGGPSDVGAVTWVSGDTVISGLISATNSAVGTSLNAGHNIGTVYNVTSDPLFVRFPDDIGGRVVAGSQSSGFAASSGTLNSGGGAINLLAGNMTILTSVNTVSANNINITANILNIGSNGNVNSTIGGNVTIQTLGAGVDLGGADSSVDFRLTQSQINNITANLLTIGNNSTGTIRITNNLTWSSNLSLKSGSRIDGTLSNNNHTLTQTNSNITAIGLITGNFVAYSPLEVTTRSDSGTGSLRVAIDYAASHPGDDTITFASSLANNMITLTSPITINDITGNVTIIGLGAASLAIDGGGTTGLFSILSNTILTNLTFSHANGGGLADGGAFYSSSNLSMTSVAINTSSASRGAAVYQSGGSLNITRSNISDSLYVTDNGSLIISGNQSLALGQITACSLTVNLSSGAISQATGANLNVSGLSNFVVSGNLNLSNTTNKFGTLKASGAEITIYDEDTIILDNILANNLTVNAIGEISQSVGSVLNVSGTTNLLSTGNISLLNSSNIFNTLNSEGLFIQTVKTGGIYLNSNSPSSVFVNSGATATFAIAVSGNSTPLIQWQKSVDGGNSWNNIAGENSPSYTFAAAAIDSNNLYRTVSTNTLGSAISLNATLSVIADPLLVITTADSGAGSLRNAIDYAATTPGDDAITFSNTLTGSLISLRAPLVINDNSGNLSISGQGLSNLTISGGGLTGIFNVQSPAIISNLTLSNGTGVSGTNPSIKGGAIYSNSSLSLLNLAINQSTANLGSAIFIDGGSVNITSSNITDSIYIANSGNLTASGSTFGSTLTAINANAISITDYPQSIELGNLNANSLTVNLNNGNVTQSAGSYITVTGSANFVASGNMTLSNATNNFNTISASGTNITVSDINVLTLGNINGNGMIQITARDISITGNVSATPSGTVQILPTGGTGVNLGNESQGNLSLTNAEMNRITSNQLSIGNATTGNIVISSSISPVTAGSLRLTTNSQIQLGANVTTFGSQLYSGPTVLTSNANLTTNNGMLTFGSTLDGAYDLYLTAGSGNIAFSGVVGSMVPPTLLDVFSAADVTGSNLNLATASGAVINRIALSGTDNTLTIESIAGQNVNTIISGSNSGSVSSSGGTSVGSFSGINKLIGSAGNDTFRLVNNSAFLSGTINGGSGTNAFNYVGTTKPIFVNLATGQATGVTSTTNTGVISSIQDVFGGTGNDYLSGSSTSNVMDGGSGDDTMSGLGGNDIMVGNYGSDNMNGGAGIDILIGGYVDFVIGSLQDGLVSIMGIWKNVTDVTFNAVGNTIGTASSTQFRLVGDTNLASTYLLQTVFNDQATDRLTDISSSTIPNWFFATERVTQGNDIVQAGTTFTVSKKSLASKTSRTPR